MAQPSLPESVRSAIANLSWKNSLQDPKPMHFKSLDEMNAIRAPPLNVLGTIHSLQQLAPVQNDKTQYLARIATSLLLLGQHDSGGLDESHDLVLSLSWRGDLPYAYGPPVNMPDEVLQALACYVHCLVHRREGPHPSEFEMTGFQNSNYWAGTAMRNLEGVEGLPLERVRLTVVELAASNPLARKFLRDNKCDEAGSWDPRFLTELCQQVVVHQAQQQQQQQHPLKEFAEQSAIAEVRILLDHVLRLMGFDL